MPYLPQTRCAIAATAQHQHPPPKENAGLSISQVGLSCQMHASDSGIPQRLVPTSVWAQQNTLTPPSKPKHDSFVLRTSQVHRDNKQLAACK